MRYGNNKSVGIIGPGQFESYLLKNITSNNVNEYISRYEAKIKAIVDKAKNETSIDAQLKSIYEDIQKSMTYRIENQADEEKRDYVASAYSIVTGQGKCAGYARIFKACVDRLGLENILVTGLLGTGKLLGLHLYNYVKINEDWYGFDVTVDDTFLEANQNGTTYFKQISME